MNTDRLQIILILILVPIGLFFLYANTQDVTLREIFLPSVPIVRVGDVAIRVDIADSESERIQGLSGRKSLDGKDAMLFVYPEAGYHSIWMKDMHFPIDIIWIDEDLTIINIEKDVTPDTYPRTYRPDRPAKYVLETSVHYSDTFNFAAGMKIALPPK